MMNKRSRFVYASGPKRPIDKKIVQVQQTVTNSQTNTLIYAATEAVTYSGGHVSWCFVGSAAGLGTWALVYVREGQTASVSNISNAATFYTPEQDVLAVGNFGSSSTDFDVVFFNMKVKTKRKMKAGDEIRLIANGSAANIGS